MKENWGDYGQKLGIIEGVRRMRKKNYKGRRITRKLSKCLTIFKAYDNVQNAYADVLENDSLVATIQCNVQFEDPELSEYTSDFVCTKTDGSVFVRECMYRKNVLRERSIKLLNASQAYWFKRGVIDWKVVIDAEAK